MVVLQPIAIGRLFFAISMAVFGIQYIAYGKYVGGLPPVPPWAPGGAVGAYLVGAFLIAAAVSLAINKRADLSAVAIGGLFLVCVLFLHLQHFTAVIHNGVDRTRAFEPLALAGAAFALAAILPSGTAPARSLGPNGGMLLLGRVIFGLCMILFGAQHFMYAAFLVALVPAWLPAHAFWIYFTGAGMIAAGLAITLNILGAVSSAALALMFGLWVLVLHGPRVLAQTHNGDELSSLFVALAFCGASLIVAGALAATKLPNQGSAPA